jgi:hypothetical protein
MAGPEGRQPNFDRTPKRPKEPYEQTLEAFKEVLKSDNYSSHALAHSYNELEDKLLHSQLPTERTLFILIQTATHGAAKALANEDIGLARILRSNAETCNKIYKDFHTEKNK